MLHHGSKNDIKVENAASRQWNDVKVENVASQQ